MHFAGKYGTNTSVEQVFGARTSFLNELLLFLLYRCGAFSVSFDTLKNTAREEDVSDERVLCRHGADTMRHLLRFFTDGNTVEPALQRMKSDQTQEARRLWIPGCFRSY